MEGLDVTARSIDSAFWHGRRVLLTGHTGFKGSWLALWLARKGAVVTGISLAPDSIDSLFEQAGVESILDRSLVLDLRDPAPIVESVRAARPEVVFHLAAQSLVRRSYAEPIRTFDTNFMGTVHLLEALRVANTVRVAVMVTTDKVYAERGDYQPYAEGDRLGGHDPYSASKAASELAIDSYRLSFLAAGGVRVASARAGNVIGGGDWSEDRLLPDAVRAWSAGRSLHIRSPDAVRPWQHVLEPLSGYLHLAQALWVGDVGDAAYNFGPGKHGESSVRRVVELAQASWGQGSTVEWGGEAEGPREASWLALDVSRARRVLGVAPRWGLEEAVSRTFAWYRAVLSGADARAACFADLDAFEARA